MGKPTGFKEYPRATQKSDPVPDRVKHYKEFEHTFETDTAKVQGARCMDCGIPFCHGDTGCPVDNLIPEFNDLVYRGRYEDALENLHTTNNFPEFTGRLCPAPCEGACTLGINEPAVAIKGIERFIIDTGFKNGWVKPQPPTHKTGKKVAVVGSGPAGMAASQQLVRMGHSVTLFEKNEKIGGLIRFGIPDFKFEKWQIDRRAEQMVAEGLVIKTGVTVGKDIPAEQLVKDFDAVILAGGAEAPRDLPIPGRELKGVHFAMEFLPQNNRRNAGIEVQNPISAAGKNVVVIGGGDTGSDCVGTSNRHGAASVTQLELFPMPPLERAASTPWPYWPMKLRTSSSHEEGAERMWSINTVRFNDDGKGNVKSLSCKKVEMKDGKFVDVDGSEFELKAELVLLAMGFVGPVKGGLLEQFEKLGLALDNRGNVKADFGDHSGAHRTTIDKVFAAGDIRRGQSLIVWAIAEGRKCANAVHSYLMQQK
ncbi:MAG TPA: glutamate synthase subunit beta [Turneriella sp.]|nr:glutamate synthase subunit beta [Turneriella sp.]HNM99625.1 glutamate synthase subunit beta [Turneriella sp.]